MCTTPTCVCKLPQACEDCYLGVSTVASPKKWITSERKRSIIVKGICVQGFWPNWVTAYDVFGSIENEWSSFSGPYYYLYLNKISDFQRVPAPEMSEAQRGQDGRMGWTLSCLEMLRHAADVTAWGELIGLQRQRASEELQAICRCGA